MSDNHNMERVSASRIDLIKENSNLEDGFLNFVVNVL